MQKDSNNQIDKIYIQRNIPLRVYWELTYDCNLRCVHCYTGNEERGGILSLNQISAIARQIGEMGALYVVLSGGDPFYRNDVMEIIELLRKEFFVVILTNATRIDSHNARKLSELNVTQIEISLFAMDESIHDSITGVKGSHAQTMRGINLLKEEGVRVAIKCPIMKQNKLEYSKVADFARELGAGYFSSPGLIPKLDGTPDPQKYYIKEREFGSYYMNWWDNNKERFKDYKKPHNKDRKSFMCSAGQTFCSITPDGYLKACSIIPVKMGSLLKQSFRELWQHKPAGSLEKLRNAGLDSFSECKTCEWASECTPCPGVNYLESDDLFLNAKSHCDLKKGMFKAMTEKMK